MNVNLYSPNGEQDNNISFIIPHKTNAVIVYLFKLDIQHPPPLDAKTRLVSGYENSRPINIILRLITPSLKETRGAYVISCIRAPHLYKDLFVYNKYTAPLGFVVTRTHAEIQVWHILSVRKTFEAKSTKAVRGMRAHTDNGPDKFYVKDLIIMSGNVSVHFLNNIQKCRAHHRDIDIFRHFCPELIIDDSVVQLDLS
ncbi:hypothetical protein [Thysanoplusia orichalcea nucleopolyhedrovirus]|uniref:Uncharacterized protein n=1 Tax=Thysanoplusia orichalcea nucleopolyhedrovirus TaxID=101850 RepID=L0CLU0_9ABAC|nr:hypothetical protein [Thysanoplusia orichalcea nucleopolyhedrovirus]AGA16293.1 hypothetical protein [Thysanoplusia orichalcea nucleopolyhedrovirus]